MQYQLCDAASSTATIFIWYARSSAVTKTPTKTPFSDVLITGCSTDIGRKFYNKFVQLEVLQTKHLAALDIHNSTSNCKTAVRL